MTITHFKLSINIASVPNFQFAISFPNCIYLPIFNLPIFIRHLQFNLQLHLQLHLQINLLCFTEINNRQSVPTNPCTPGGYKPVHHKLNQSM